MNEIVCHIEERVACFAALSARVDDPAQLHYTYLRRQFAVALAALGFCQSSLAQSAPLAVDTALRDQIAAFKCGLAELGGRDAAMYSLQLQQAMPRKTPAVERQLQRIHSLYDHMSLDYRGLRSPGPAAEKRLRRCELETLLAALNAVYVTIEQRNAGVIIQRIHELDQTIGRRWDGRALLEI